MLEKNKAPPLRTPKPICQTLEYDYQVSNHQILKDLIEAFQKKADWALFYKFDADQKGYLDFADIEKVYVEIGYDSLKPEQQITVYKALIALCTASNNITIKDLHNIDLDEVFPNKLGRKQLRERATNREDALYEKYLDPERRNRVRGSALFHCKSDQDKARLILRQLQKRYAAMHRPGIRLKAWDINKDGRIEKGEIMQVLHKMSIHLNENELDAFFGIFQKNEKEKGVHLLNDNIWDDSISFPIFLDTILGFDRFDPDKKISPSKQYKGLSNVKKEKKEAVIPNNEEMDYAALCILDRLRHRAEMKFGSKQLTTDVFNFLDSNHNESISHFEFRTNLRRIDFEMSQDEADKIIKLMDPLNTKEIRYLAFAKCFNLELPQKKVYYENETTPRMLEIDPLSTYYVSAKDQFSKTKFAGTRKLTKGLPTKKNNSNAKYDILEWKV